MHLRLRLSGVRRGGRMLSVAKLALGQEAYYEQQVARGLDDYYAGRGESPGIWAGGASVGLGLVGVVGDEDLGTLLRGVNPANDERLRAPVRERTITARALDLESGEWREEPKTLKPVSATTSSSRVRRALACCTPSPMTSTCAVRSARRTRLPG